MRLIIRAIILITLLLIVVLMSGYGVLMGTQKNANAPATQCKYLTSQGIITVLYFQAKKDGMSVMGCPVWRKEAVTGNKS